jgi:TIR domain-containing protein/uncharacterized protein DUF3298
MEKSEYQIFISYARPDRDVAVEIYDALAKKGFHPWMDCKKLLGGQNWDFEIERALSKSEIVIALVSPNSIDRRGYLQRELRFAFDKMREKLVDDIFIVAILHDTNDIPERFREFHCLHASDADFQSQLERSLNTQIERLGGREVEQQNEEEIYWSKHTRREVWDGIPGYEIEIQTFQFKSDRYANVEDIGEYVTGVFLREFFRHRENRLQPSPDLHNYAQDKFFRTDTYDAHCSGPTIKKRVLNLKYVVDWYGAGAAHPNHGFVTFAFVLDPLILIERLAMIFEDADEALAIIRDECRSQLRLNEHLDDEWIERGTAEWDAYAAFVFGEEGIELSFSPYQVGAYAVGPQFALVPYLKVVGGMKREFQTALGIQYLRHRQ